MVIGTRTWCPLSPLRLQTGPTRHGAEAVLEGDVVDLEYHAVDGVAESIAAREHLVVITLAAFDTLDHGRLG